MFNYARLNNTRAEEKQNHGSQSANLHLEWLKLSKSQQ